MPPKLTVCYDPGTSVSKILYQLDSGQVKHLTMEPEVFCLPVATSLPTTNNFGRPSDCAWVQLPQDETCYAVGRLARNYRATVSIKRLKYESLVPKVLAALGAIATVENLPQKFNLDLALLLPLGEYANRDELEKLLKEALKGFNFQSRPYKVNLGLYKCCAEGFGLALSYIKEKGLKQFQNSTLAYLMFGYRNTSILVFKNGTLVTTQSNTTQLGFYDLIDKMTAKISGLSREEVQAAIVTKVQKDYDWDNVEWKYHQTTEIVIEDLIKSTDPDKMALEEAQILKAIELATAQYWQLLSDWLYESLPPMRQLDGVIYGGGACQLLKPQLDGYWQDVNLEMECTKTYQSQLFKALSLDSSALHQFNQQNLVLRFADVWGLFVQFANYQSEDHSAA